MSCHVCALCRLCVCGALSRNAQAQRMHPAHACSTPSRWAHLRRRGVCAKAPSRKAWRGVAWRVRHGPERHRRSWSTSSASQGPQTRVCHSRDAQVHVLVARKEHGQMRLAARSLPLGWITGDCQRSTHFPQWNAEPNAASMSAPPKEHRTSDRAQEKRCALCATCRRRLHAVHATAQRRAGASRERSAQPASGSAAAAHRCQPAEEASACTLPPRLVGLCPSTASLWCGNAPRV